MAELVGIRSDFALFSDGDLGVFVRLSSLDVFDPQPLIALQTSDWAESCDPASVPTEAWELADTALSNSHHVDGTDVLIAAAPKDKRTFAVPKAVQAEAKKALAWRKEYNRGGTDVGLNTARTLAKGESIGIKKIRHIAKYFPRHEVDKSGKGWSPDEDGFPSNGRIAWALWGGDPAWRWAKRIVERDDARMKNASSLAATESDAEETMLEDETAVPDENAVNPQLPHVYEPDVANNYACAVCGGYEFALKHISPDSISEPDSATELTDDEIQTLVAEAIEYLEQEGLETLTSMSEPGVVDALYVTDPSRDTWQVWDDHARTWSELSEHPADVIELDTETAKLIVALSTDLSAKKSVENIVGPEASMTYEALSSLDEYITTDVSYYTGNGRIYVYSGDTNDLWVWDSNTTSWQETTHTIESLAEIDESTARQRVITDRPTSASINDIHMEFDRAEYFGSYSLLDRASHAIAYVKGLSTLVASTPANASKENLFAAGEDTKKPTYAAVVDDYDNDIVLALIAIMPKIGDNPPQVLSRKEGSWVPDQKLFLDLQSANPPTLVILDNNALSRVQRQVDFYYRERGKQVTDTIIDNEAATSILTAAGVPGIADTPSDFRAVRRLKRYWSYGPGAAKIRWGTPGDWRRCVRLLSKYMGTRSRGYCQNLHKSVTGVYTGDRRNPGRRKRRRGLSVEGDVLLQVPTMVLTTENEVNGTNDTVLASLGIPSVRDMQNLRTREPGHRLQGGERFLVNGGDGTYVLSVLPVGSTIGWQGESAIIVSDPQRGTMVLRETEG